MKKLLLIWLLALGSWFFILGTWNLSVAQDVWFPWKVWFPWTAPPDSAGTPDSTLSVYVIASVDNESDSVDVFGYVNFSSLVDSTYWFINQEDVAVTWENADSLIKAESWLSAVTFTHGLTENGFVSLGLAVLDLAGDTTAIARRDHQVNAFEDSKLNYVLNHLLY
jgi:hypothetical protein